MSTYAIKERRSKPGFFRFAHKGNKVRLWHFPSQTSVRVCPAPGAVDKGCPHRASVCMYVCLYVHISDHPHIHTHTHCAQRKTLYKKSLFNKNKQQMQNFLIPFLSFFFHAYSKCRQVCQGQVHTLIHKRTHIFMQIEKPPDPLWVKNQVWAFVCGRGPCLWTHMFVCSKNSSYCVRVQ